jgi:tetratricopeptide (TPR) repeat protein
LDKETYNRYANAVALMEAGKYEVAITAFEALDGYKDSNDKIKQCLDNQYAAAEALMEAGKYEEAIAAFEELDGYKDSADNVETCKYNRAVSLVETDPMQALVLFTEVKTVKDAIDYLK